MKKDRLIETINELPSEFDLDELIEKLIFKEKIEKGLKQLRDGNTKSHEQVKELARKW
jgi:hypothetical protein